MLNNNIFSEFQWHWITITKVFENGNKTYINFSTWGQRRVFTLEDYYNYSSYGAIIYFDYEECC